MAKTLRWGWQVRDKGPVGPTMPRWSFCPEAHFRASGAGMCSAHSQACLGMLGKGVGNQIPGL